MWQNIQQLLPKAAGKYNFTETLKAVEVCQACRNLIKQYLPAEAEKNVSPRSFKEGILTIGASNPSWANQLQMSSHRIHRSLKAKFGEKAVKRIRVIQNQPADGEPENSL